MNNRKESLPEGWRLAKLGEACSIVGGGTPSRSNSEYFTGNIPWVTPTDIDKERILHITTSSQFITEAGLKESSARLLPIGAVLLTSRAGIGYVAIAGCELATNQGFVNFVCSPDLDNLYLAHWLRANVDMLNSLASGTTFKEISRGTVKEIEIALPPLEEQRRLVKLLSEQFSALHHSRIAAEAQLATLKKLPTALLRAAFDFNQNKESNVTPPPPE